VCKEFYEDSQTLLAQISGSLTSIGKFAEISKLASRIRILSKNKKNRSEEQEKSIWCRCSYFNSH
jgi:hypothetical protein